MAHYFRNREGVVARVLGARDERHARQILDARRPREGWRASGRRFAVLTYRVEHEVRRKPRLVASSRALEPVRL